MAKLKLIADPTFKAEVPIDVPGKAEPVEVGFTFKHRTASELDRFFKDEMPGMDKPDAVMAVVTAWEFDEAFTRENVAVLIDQRHTVLGRIFETYSKELYKARMGN